MNGHFRGHSCEQSERDGERLPVGGIAPTHQPRLGSSGAPSAGLSAGGGDGETKTRRSGDALAGLPAHVMDELVEDMAEAVVAVLLDKEVLGLDDDDSDDARSNLRQI